MVEFDVSSISLISTGISLVAFIVAAALAAFKANSARTKNLIESASAADRGPLVLAALETLKVDTSGLTKEQQYQIALRLLDERSARLKINAAIVIVIAMLTAAIAIYAIRDPRDLPASSSAPAGASDPKVNRSLEDSALKTWPSKFSDLNSAKIMASEVDDDMIISVNNVDILKVHFGETPEPINIMSLLHPGANKIQFTVFNGKYGGCNGRVQVFLNETSNSEYDWRIAVPIESACADCNCGTLVKTLYLQ